MGSWRQNLQPFLTDSCGNIYEFGVYSGQSLCELSKLFDYNHIYGFDSFAGLPKEKEEPDWLPEWGEGNFNAQQYFQVDDVNECVKATSNFLIENGINRFTLIPGFYEDVLTENLVKELNLKPATYVDIDCDIYSSAYCVLDFLFKNRLLVHNSIIGFDDWWSPGFESCQSGESRAMKEIFRKYSVKCRRLFQIGNTKPHVHAAFQLI